MKGKQQGDTNFCFTQKNKEEESAECHLGGLKIL